MKIWTKSQKKICLETVNIVLILNWCGLCGKEHLCNPVLWSLDRKGLGRHQEDARALYSDEGL